MPATPTIDHAMSMVTPDRQAAVTRVMLRHGLNETDPLIEVIPLLVDVDAASQAAIAAAQAAVGAADRIEKSTASVGDAIYQQTLKAGADLQGIVTTALHSEVVKTGKSLLEAISKSTALGAQKIEQAALGLDEIAKKQQAANVRAWRDDFAAAARLEMKSRLARSWAAIALTVLLCLGLGAGLMFGGLYYVRKIVPWGWHVASPGPGDCGTVTSASGGRGTVCLAHRS